MILTCKANKSRVPFKPQYYFSVTNRKQNIYYNVTTMAFLFKMFSFCYTCALAIHEQKQDQIENESQEILWKCTGATTALFTGKKS